MVEVTGASVPGCFALRALLDVLGPGAASDMEASAGDAADEAARDWDARRTLLFFSLRPPPTLPFLTLLAAPFPGVLDTFDFATFEALVFVGPFLDSFPFARLLAAALGDNL